MEIEKELNAAAAKGKIRTDLEDELEELCRQGLKLNDEIHSKLGEGDPNTDDSSSVLAQMGLLAALRKGSEDDVTKNAGRSVSGSKPKRDLKRKLDGGSQTSHEDRDSVAADSPTVSSPKVQLLPLPSLLGL